MPKKAPELSDVAVRNLRHGHIKGDPKVAPEKRKHKVGDPCPAFHPVGGVAGLLLVCRPPADGQEVGPRSWVLRVKIGDKRRDIGLGGYPDVTLSQARQKARTVKEKISQGIDPVAEKKALRSALAAEQAKLVTFSGVANEYIHKKSREFKTAKQVQKLVGQLEAYAFPHIGHMVVADIERAHIVRMLDPIWSTKTETASRVRLHVERILDLAGVKGLRTGDNPARWKGNLDLSFAKRDKVSKVEHYRSLPVADMPEFWQKIQVLDTMSAKALQFIILTAARSGEVRGATWDEVDLSTKLWTIPAERIKGGKKHVVPLPDAAVALLESLPRLSQYLFTGARGGQITDATISKAPKRIGYDVTAHGFRATFRTWTQEYTAYPEEVCELALAHVNSDATRAAYARGELVGKRRLLMADWAKFCREGLPKGATVANIGGRGSARP